MEQTNKVKREMTQPAELCEAVECNECHQNHCMIIDYVVYSRDKKKDIIFYTCTACRHKQSSE